MPISTLVKYHLIYPAKITLCRHSKYEYGAPTNIKDDVLNCWPEIPPLVPIHLCLCFYTYKDHALFYVKMGISVGVPKYSSIFQK